MPRLVPSHRLLLPCSQFWKFQKLFGCSTAELTTYLNVSQSTRSFLTTLCLICRTWHTELAVVMLVNNFMNVGETVCWWNYQHTISYIFTIIIFHQYTFWSYLEAAWLKVFHQHTGFTPAYSMNQHFSSTLDQSIF